MKESGDADDEEDKAEDDVFVASEQGNDEAKDDKGDDGQFESKEGGAGEQVSGADAEEDADVHGSLDKQDVGEGEREEGDEWDDDDEPVPVMWILAEERSDGEDEEQGAEGQATSYGKNSQAPTGIGCGG